MDTSTDTSTGTGQLTGTASGRSTDSSAEPVADLVAELRDAARRADPVAALAEVAIERDPQELLRRLARLQDGQYAVRQARALGVGRHATAWLARSGRAEQVARGVARFAGAVGDPDPAITAALRCWPLATIGHGSAALHHGLTTDAPPTPELVVPHSSGCAPAGVTVHRTRSLPATDRLWVDTLAYTSLARTVCDLADGDDPSGTLARVDDAVALGAAPRWLHQRANELTDGRDGVALVRDATDPELAAAFRSWLERLFGVIVRVASLPEPRWNAPVHDAQGFIGIVDALWACGLISEQEGMRFHTTPAQRQADAARFNRLLAAGHAVRRFSYRDVVDHPVHVAVTLATALRQAGEDVDLARIPRHIELPAR